MVDFKKLAIVALELCNSKHDQDGRVKIPLEEIAEELYVQKEDIQAAFDHLVEEGIIFDDGDRDHMNYSDGMDELIRLLKEMVTVPTTSQ
ncbi:MAG: hypothetical protein ACXACI_16705 [Candidatus Hodarchaeales archaeon]|jgi:hypothetical protein